VLKQTMAAGLMAVATAVSGNAYAQNGPGGATASAAKPKVRAKQAQTERGPRVPRILRQIAECESGGNPRAVSPDGLYRGKYQFSRPTWRAYGGQGDPAAAPEAEQDRRAIKLYRAEGTAPWPNCA
jgi:hypothetical protein